MRHQSVRLESAAAPAPLRKGEMTRVAILDAALELSSRDGLEGLTIGLLAERMQMSKSGVFAHFGSREDLQVEVVREYHRRFEQEVLPLAARAARVASPVVDGATLDGKAHPGSDHGCIYISGAVEYDDRAESPVRDELVKSVTIWRAALMRAIDQAKEEGHLRADCDPRLMLFEMYSLELACITTPVSFACRTAPSLPWLRSTN
jgi:AcrR family transcriptional regulator